MEPKRPRYAEDNASVAVVPTYELKSSSSSNIVDALAPELFIQSLATRLRRLVKQKPPVPVVEFRELLMFLFANASSAFSEWKFRDIVRESLKKVKDVLVDSKDSWLANHLTAIYFDPPAFFYILFNDNFIFAYPESRSAAAAAKKSGPLTVQPPSQRRLEMLDSTLEAVFEMFGSKRQRTDPFEERTEAAIDGRIRSVLLDFNWRKMIRKTHEDVMDVMELIVSVIVRRIGSTDCTVSKSPQETYAEDIMRQLGPLFKDHIILDDGCVLPAIELQSDETLYFSKPVLTCSAILQFELLAETCDATVFFNFVIELQKEGDVVTFMDNFTPQVKTGFNESIARCAVEYMPKTHAALTGISNTAVLTLCQLIGTVKEAREQRLSDAIGATTAKTERKLKKILMIFFLSFKGFLLLSRRINRKFTAEEMNLCLSQLASSISWAFGNEAMPILPLGRLIPIVLLALEWVNKLKTHKQTDDTIERLGSIISILYMARPKTEDSLFVEGLSSEDLAEQVADFFTDDAFAYPEVSSPKDTPLYVAIMLNMINRRLGNRMQKGALVNTLEEWREHVHILNGLSQFENRLPPGFWVELPGDHERAEKFGGIDCVLNSTGTFLPVAFVVEPGECDVVPWERVSATVSRHIAHWEMLMTLGVISPEKRRMPPLKYIVTMIMEISQFIFVDPRCEPVADYGQYIDKVQAEIDSCLGDNAPVGFDRNLFIGEIAKLLVCLRGQRVEDYAKFDLYWQSLRNLLQGETGTAVVAPSGSAQQKEWDDIFRRGKQRIRAFYKDWEAKAVNTPNKLSVSVKIVELLRIDVIQHVVKWRAKSPCKEVVLRSVDAMVRESLDAKVKSQNSKAVAELVNAIVEQLMVLAPLSDDFLDRCKSLAPIHGMDAGGAGVVPRVEEVLRKLKVAGPDVLEQIGIYQCLELIVDYNQNADARVRKAFYEEWFKQSNPFYESNDRLYYWLNRMISASINSTGYQAKLNPVHCSPFRPRIGEPKVERADTSAGARSKSTSPSVEEVPSVIHELLSSWKKNEDGKIGNMSLIWSVLQELDRLKADGNQGKGHSAKVAEFKKALGEMFAGEKELCAELASMLATVYIENEKTRAKAVKKGVISLQPWFDSDGVDNICSPERKPSLTDDASATKRKIQAQVTEISGVPAAAAVQIPAIVSCDLSGLSAVGVEGGKFLAEAKSRLPESLEQLFTGELTLTKVQHLRESLAVDLAEWRVTVPDVKKFSEYVKTLIVQQHHEHGAIAGLVANIVTIESNNSVVLSQSRRLLEKTVNSARRSRPQADRADEQDDADNIVPVFGLQMKLASVVSYEARVHAGVAKLGSAFFQSRDMAIVEEFVDELESCKLEFQAEVVDVALYGAYLTERVMDTKSGSFGTVRLREVAGRISELATVAYVEQDGELIARKQADLKKAILAVLSAGDVLNQTPAVCYAEQKLPQIARVLDDRFGFSLQSELKPSEFTRTFTAICDMHFSRWSKHKGLLASTGGCSELVDSLVRELRTEILRHSVDVTDVDQFMQLIQSGPDTETQVANLLSMYVAETMRLRPKKNLRDLKLELVKKMTVNPDPGAEHLVDNAEIAPSTALGKVATEFDRRLLENAVFTVEEFSITLRNEIVASGVVIYDVSQFLDTVHATVLNTWGEQDAALAVERMTELLWVFDGSSPETYLEWRQVILRSLPLENAQLSAKILIHNINLPIPFAMDADSKKLIVDLVLFLDTEFETQISRLHIFRKRMTEANPRKAAILDGAGLWCLAEDHHFRRIQMFIDGLDSARREVAEAIRCFADLTFEEFWARLERFNLA